MMTKKKIYPDNGAKARAAPDSAVDFFTISPRGLAKTREKMLRAVCDLHVRTRSSHAVCTDAEVWHTPR